MSLAHRTIADAPPSALEHQASATDQFTGDFLPWMTVTAVPGGQPVYRMTRGRESSEPLSWMISPKPDPAAQNDSTRAVEAASKDLVMMKAPPLSPHRFKSLQAWEGTVEQIGETTFTARLFDRERPGEEETAEFELSDVNDYDRSLVALGAVFYWDVGYLITPSGNRRASEIRFRRLPAWTREELEAARQEAAEFRELVGWK